MELGHISKILNCCAILRLHQVQPKYLKAREVHIGEEDHFHFIAKEGNQWLFYRNTGKDLSMNEQKALREYAKSVGISGEIQYSNGLMQMPIPDHQGKFYDSISEIQGCRVMPVTLQRDGDVYVCIEFHENSMKSVSDKILDFVQTEYPYRKTILYMGVWKSNLPYLLNLYSSFGNSLQNFSLIKTRWEFNEGDALSGNDGVFLNHGIFVPKQFVDGETDTLIWRMENADVKSGTNYEIVDAGDHVVETRIKTKFFADFYRNVVKSYSGPVFYGAKCDGTGLSSYYIVEKGTQSMFLAGLNNHLNRSARIRHKNYLLEITELGISGNANEFTF